MNPVNCDECNVTMPQFVADDPRLHKCAAAELESEPQLQYLGTEPSPVSEYGGGTGFENWLRDQPLPVIGVDFSLPRIEGLLRAAWVAGAAEALGAAADRYRSEVNPEMESWNPATVGSDDFEGILRRYAADAAAVIRGGNTNE